MCLLVFAWKAHADYPLIVAANRDEFHSRPAQPARWWPDQADLLAGRDLQAGGTWLAVSRNGRFATVTNYREAQKPRPDLRSRGEIVTGFVAGEASAGDFVGSFDGDRYAGVSVLVSDGESVGYVSNRGDPPRTLEPGVYGLSNASLDTPWSKLVRTRDALSRLVESGAVDETSLFRLLSDPTPAPHDDIGAGDLPFDLARAVTAPFIVTDAYGTRCSTIVLRGADGKIRFTERRFDPVGRRTGDSSFEFTVLSNDRG